jgi:hypothetical protein
VRRRYSNVTGRRRPQRPARAGPEGQAGAARDLTLPPAVGVVTVMPLARNMHAVAELTPVRISRAAPGSWRPWLVEREP